MDLRGAGWVVYFLPFWLGNLRMADVAFPSFVFLGLTKCQSVCSA